MQDTTAPRTGKRELGIAAIATVFITLVRLYFNRRINFCGTPDSCSYLALGESLSRHHGFVQNFLYQYQFLALKLPSHGIEYWRPGTSFLLLLAQPFGGVTLHSASAVITLLAIPLAMCAWRISMDWSSDRAIALASYLICLVLPPIWIGATTPDSAIPYAIFAALFLLNFTVRFRSYGRDALAFVGVAGVNLIRNDAILLFAPLVVVLFLRLRAARSTGQTTGERTGATPAYAALMVVFFGVALLPMNLIDLLVLGKAFPPGTSGTIYLTDLSDLMKYGPPLNLRTMMAVGAGALVKARLLAVPMIVYRILFILLGFGAVFLPLLCLRRYNTEGSKPAAMPELAGSATFCAVVVLVYGLVLPAIGTFSALRSFCGLLPIASVLMVAAIRSVANSERAATWLAVTLVIFYFTSGVMQDRRTVDDVAKVEDRDRRVAQYLATTGAAPEDGHTLVMTGDAAAFFVQTGYRTIPIPNDNLDMMAAATHDLHATHILIDRDFIQTSTEEIERRLRPSADTIVPGTHMLVLTVAQP